MEKMMIQDLRFDGRFFQDEIENYLRNMLSDIGHHFLSKINYQFEVKDTHILLFYFGNIDDKRNISKEHYSLGDREFGSIGQTSFDFSENYILSLNDEEKRLFLLDIFYKSIKDYAVYFNEKTELLDEAYTKVLNEGFYENVTGFAPTRNKLYRCWVEKLLNYKNSDYRLAFQDNTTGIIEYYFVGKKINLDLRKKTSLEIMKIPTFFKVEGWKKNEFRVRWGEYGNELYIFDMVSKTLRMEINEVELPDFLE
jgi:hypothetical protein